MSRTVSFVGVAVNALIWSIHCFKVLTDIVCYHHCDRGHCDLNRMQLLIRRSKVVTPNQEIMRLIVG